MDERFQRDRYIVRKKILSFLGGTFTITDESGRLLFYSKQKAFKLKEDIRLYSDETMSEEMLTIHARSMIDFGATYDVTDVTSGESVGSLQRKGWKSILRDEWQLLTPEGDELGILREDNTAMALLRRFIGIIPQTFMVSIGGVEVARITQQFNFFTMVLDVDFSPDAEELLDRRLGLAAAVLLCAVEGRQGDG